MRILGYIFLTFILTGCANHTYYYYEFKADNIATDFGIVKGYLKGAFNKIHVNPDVTNYGNPYSLHINFHSNNKTSLPIAIKEIHVIKENGAILSSHSGNKMDLRWSDYHKKWIGSWREKRIELDHKIVVVRFSVELSVNGDTIFKNYSFTFKPSYREEKRNNFWDGLMSV